jgi:hypothetical protein
MGENRNDILGDTFIKMVIEEIQKAKFNQEHECIQIKVSNLVIHETLYFETILQNLYKKHQVSTKKVEITFKNIEFNDLAGFTINQKSASLIRVNFDNCCYNSLIFEELSYPAGLSFLFYNNCKIKSIDWRDSILGNYAFIGGEILGMSNYREYSQGNIKQHSMVGTVRLKSVTLGCKNTLSSNIQLKNLDFLGSLEFAICTFHEAPSFLNSKINHSTIFSKCHFHDKSQSSIAPYRLLRSEMQRLGNEREAVMFGSLEMEAYHQAEFQGRKISGSDKIEKYASWVYRLFNSYGRDVLTPFLWIFVFWTALFFGIYDILNLTTVAIGNDHPVWMAQFFQEGKEAPFIKSLWNTLGPISLLFKSDVIQASNAGGAFLFMFQKVTASLMWFLWILQIRRRFKLS